MKILINIWNALLLITIMLAYTNCKKENEEAKKNDAATKEFAAIDKNFSGNTTQDDSRNPIPFIKDEERTYIPIKKENVGGPKDDECPATDADYQSVINQMITSSNTQYTNTSSWTDLRVGVVRMNHNCGGYPELEVYMDAEDHNNATSTSGWLGDNYTDSHGNIHLYFCIVEATYFERLKYADYGLLKVESELPDLISEARVKIDNEDSQNNNFTTLNGVNINTNQGGSGLLPYSGNMYFDHNSYFDFYILLRDPYGASALPTLSASIGLDYGVIGKHASATTGEIYSDDEDKHNINFCIYDIWNDLTYQHTGFISSSAGVPDILELVGSGSSPNGNSKWYFSRAF